MLKNVYYSVSTSLYYTIRFEVVGVYVFAQTPLLFLYMFLVAYGFCADRFSDKSTAFCFLIVLYLFSNSFLVLLVCRSSTTRKWVGKLVGFDFLEKYPPKKGVVNLLILFVTTWAILGIDIVSMHYLFSAKLQQMDACSVLIEQAFNNNDLDQAHIYQKLKLEIFESHPDGIITGLHSTYLFQLVHCTFG